MPHTIGCCSADSCCGAEVDLTERLAAGSQGLYLVLDVTMHCASDGGSSPTLDCVAATTICGTD